jgi:hypothetical protein
MCDRRLSLCFKNGSYRYTLFLVCVTFFALWLFYCVTEDDIFFLVKFSFIKPKSWTVHIAVTIVVTFVACVSHLRFLQQFCRGLCQ